MPNNNLEQGCLKVQKVVSKWNHITTFKIVALSYLNRTKGVKQQINL